ncbi:MAG: hypothetical protein KIH89_000735 [Candidatus Shapirobacteria bacterium]|nr:hypothetical protein [Candidatus Shapirobacteria bacterium]
MKENNIIKETSLIQKEVNTPTSEQFTSTAKLYATVFSGPPWNESVKCSLDGQFKGLDTPLGSRCSCGGIFVEAYPLEETVEYIKEESKKPKFKFQETVNAEGETIGFAWSYLTTPTKLAQSKWDNSDDQQKIINILEQKGIAPNQEIRYISECGVDPNFRGNGIANLLTDIVSGPETTVYRTNCFSPMMAVATRLEFTQIMGPEVIIDRSNKTIIETGRYINFLDNQNPQRTLFIKT